MAQQQHERPTSLICFFGERPHHQRVLLVVAQIPPNAISPHRAADMRLGACLVASAEGLHVDLGETALDHQLLQPGGRPAGKPTER